MSPGAVFVRCSTALTRHGAWADACTPGRRAVSQACRTRAPRRVGWSSEPINWRPQEEPTPATGANVDEARVQQTLYVDAANGEAADDDKHGTAEAPFATVAYACGVAGKLKDADRGVKVLVGRRDVPRDGRNLPARRPARARHVDAPLVIEAAEHDQTVIDGADAEGWTPSTWQDGRRTLDATRGPRCSAEGTYRGNRRPGPPR